MSSSPTLIFMVIFFLESLAAMLQNGFMVTVLGREWVRRRTLPAGDMIVASLAASRFCLHGVAILNNLLIFFGFYFVRDYYNTLWHFVNTLTLWLTAWLAVFYCVKVAVFSHPVFFWLKWRISRLVPRLLLGSLVLVGLTVISSAIVTGILKQMIASKSSQGNSTWAERVQAFYRSFHLFDVMLMWSVPFLLFLVSMLLLVFSLCRHLGLMRNYRQDPCDPSTRVHTMALKSLVFFLVFYTSYFLSLVVVATEITNFQSHWYWAWEVVTYASICLHSSMLVLSSPKLRKVLMTRLWKALDKG
ncbi:taste receptor type 2 member 143 [Vulpes vulpes]|uniref:Taste receptor type 2 n=1 Tax=Vulpes vulpes TaxID=9627 RepID=A0A3Q7ULT5_VULVU|nr:taste receptor type 2 member 143-like [Vulpes vulpes]